MSFRLRLALFFALIVVVPMVVVAALLVGISNTSRSAKADARLDGGVRTALAIYRRDLGQARRAARAIAANAAVQAAIRQGDPAAIRTQVAVAAQANGALAFAIHPPSGPAIESGPRDAVAIARVGLTTAGGSQAGSLDAATTTATAFTRRVRRLTGLDGAVVEPAGALGGTLAVRRDAAGERLL